MSILIDNKSDKSRLVICDTEAGNLISAGDNRDDNNYTYIISVAGNVSYFSKLQGIVKAYVGTASSYQYHSESLKSPEKTNWSKVFSANSEISQYITSQKLYEHSAEKPRRILVCGQSVDGNDPSTYIALHILVKCWGKTVYEALEIVREKMPMPTLLHKNAVQALMDASNLSDEEQEKIKTTLFKKQESYEQPKKVWEFNYRVA